MPDAGRMETVGKSELLRAGDGSRSEDEEEDDKEPTSPWPSPPEAERE
jgi:hypothetical protein